MRALTLVVLLCALLATAAATGSVASAEPPAAGDVPATDTTQPLADPLEPSGDAGPFSEGESADDIDHAPRALRQREQRYRAIVNSLQAHIDELGAERDQAEEDYNDALDAYAQHLVDMYEAGAPSADIASLIAARDMGEAIDTLQVLQTVAEHDRAIVEQYRGALDRIDGIDRELQAANDRLDVAASALDDVSQQIDDAVGVTVSDRVTGPDPVYGTDDVPTLDQFFTTSPLMNLGMGLAAAAGPTANTRHLPRGWRPTGDARMGEASWYGPGFDGQHTANHEIYDQEGFTAASKELPFNSWVKVTLLSNGKSVFVRINDRGPYVGGRILDLSHGAARAIGLEGVGQVKVEVYGPPA